MNIQTKLERRGKLAIARNLYEKKHNLTIGNIAELLSVCPQSIRRAANNCGWEKRPRRTNNGNFKQLIIKKLKGADNGN